MSFAYRNQPWKFLLITFRAAVLAVKLPLYAIIYVFPSARPRHSWSIRRSLTVLVAQAYFNTLYDIDPAMMNRTTEEPTTAEEIAEAETFGFVWVDAAPEFVAGEIRKVAALNGVVPAKISGYWHGRRGPFGKAGQRASEKERVIYHLHGGGFVSGTGHPSSKEMKILLGGLIEYVAGNPRVFAPEYRLSSTSPFPKANPFPAALLDAVAGYRYLVRDLGFLPSNILVSGDSSGGLLALWLVQYLAAQKFPELPIPGALLLLSPTTDFANTRMEAWSSMESNRAYDYVGPILESRYTLRALLGNIPESEASQNTWIAPGSCLLPHTPGLYSGFPKTCIVAGGAEQTLDATVLLKNRFEYDLSSGPFHQSVKYLEALDATHDFLLGSWHEPERMDILKEIKRWAEEQIWPENNHIV